MSRSTRRAALQDAKGAPQLHCSRGATHFGKRAKACGSVVAGAGTATGVPYLPVAPCSRQADRFETSWLQDATGAPQLQPHSQGVVAVSRRRGLFTRYRRTPTCNCADLLQQRCLGGQEGPPPTQPNRWCPRSKLRRKASQWHGFLMCFSIRPCDSHARPV